MATGNEVPTLVDYDTDAVSVTSTASEDNAVFYDVEDVVAEKREDGIPMYLVKWQGWGWQSYVFCIEG
jgi:hypothetical protein